jgi:AraC-like DNA-binding protein
LSKTDRVDKLLGAVRSLTVAVQVSMSIPSIEVLWTARYDYSARTKLIRHSHSYFQMIYCLGGMGRFFVEDREYALDHGLLFLLKPRKEHGLHSTGMVRTLDIKFLVRDRRLRDALLDVPEVIPQKDTAVAGLLEQIRNEGEAKAAFYRELCNAYLLELLVGQLRHGQKESSVEAEMGENGSAPGDAVVRKTLEFIRTRYAENLTLGEIASAVGGSDRHIRRHFEVSLGMPPMRYLLHYRVKRSKELIQNTDCALKEVAELAGFKSIHHFSRVFHEVAGETPGAWRQKYRAGICKDVCIDPGFSNAIWTVKEEGSEQPGANSQNGS